MTSRRTGPCAALAVVIVLSACTGDVDGAGPPRSSETATSQRVTDRSFTLRPGHCWFEPVRVDRVTWEVEPADQFGWGDGVRRWKGKGILRQVADDHLVFIDAQGRHIDLWPSGHPNVADDGETRYCL